MTIQPITLLGASLCLGALFFRYRSRRRNGPRRSRKQQFRIAHVILLALIAWMAVFYSLQHTIVSLDGSPAKPASLLERVVGFLKN